MKTLKRKKKSHSGMSQSSETAIRDKEVADFAVWKQEQYEVASRLRSDLERQQRRLERLCALSETVSGKAQVRRARDDDEELVPEILRDSEILREQKETDSSPSLRPAGRQILAQDSSSTADITTHDIIKTVVDCFPRAMNCLFLGTKQEMAKIQMDLMTGKATRKNRRHPKTSAIAWGS